MSLNVIPHLAPVPSSPTNISIIPLSQPHTTSGEREHWPPPTPFAFHRKASAVAPAAGPKSCSSPESTRTQPLNTRKMDLNCALIELEHKLERTILGRMELLHTELNSKLYLLESKLDAIAGGMPPNLANMPTISHRCHQQRNAKQNYANRGGRSGRDGGREEALYGTPCQQKFGNDLDTSAESNRAPQVEAVVRSGGDGSAAISRCSSCSAMSMPVLGQYQYSRLRYRQENNCRWNGHRNRYSQGRAQQQRQKTSTCSLEDYYLSGIRKAGGPTNWVGPRQQRDQHYLGNVGPALNNTMAQANKWIPLGNGANGDGLAALGAEAIAPPKQTLGSMTLGKAKQKQWTSHLLVGSYTDEEGEEEEEEEEEDNGRNSGKESEEKTQKGWEKGESAPEEASPEAAEERQQIQVIGGFGNGRRTRPGNSGAQAKTAENGGSGKAVAKSEIRRNSI